MQGCNVPLESNTLSVCIHGKPLKFNCDKCYAPMNSCKCLCHLANGGECCKSCNGYAYTNEISQHDKLKKSIFDLECKIGYEILRITELDKHHLRQIDENRKISRRVDEIEERISKIESQLGKNILDSYVKKPHKCPICEGSGKYQTLDSSPPYVLHNECKCCDKGIVWG